VPKGSSISMLTNAYECSISQRRPGALIVACLQSPRNDPDSSLFNQSHGILNCCDRSLEVLYEEVFCEEVFSEEVSPTNDPDPHARLTAVRSGSFFERQLSDQDQDPFSRDSCRQRFQFFLSRLIRMVHSLHINIFTYSDDTVTMAFLD
jgi:hypothetical protein